MSRVILGDDEEEELYVLLKPREDDLPKALGGVLRRIEQALFQRLTIEKMEKLAARFTKGR